MKKVLAGIGFVGFAALALLHVVSLYRIAVYYGPGLHWIAAAGAGLLWLTFLGLVGRGMYVRQLRLPMGVVFGYGMIILFAGMRVLDGVPSTIGEGKWRDPNHVLSAKTEFLLHNHGEVKRVLSKPEYDLYQAYACAYFSAGAMVFAAAASLGPLDRTGQLFRKRRPAVWTRLT
jgi:hypothetical protein